MLISLNLSSIFIHFNYQRSILETFPLIHTLINRPKFNFKKIFIFKRMCKMCITSRYLFCSLLLSLILITSLNAQDLKNNQLAQQYYEQGEVEKAQSIYEKLAKNRQNIPFIHRSYLELLLNKQAFKQAEAYIQQLQKWFPENIY